VAAFECPLTTSLVAYQTRIAPLDSALLPNDPPIDANYAGVATGATRQWLGQTRATGQSTVHLSPIEFTLPAMQYASRAGENVLNLFDGSGSTMIATSRRAGPAYLMELDALTSIREAIRVGGPSLRPRQRFPTVRQVPSELLGKGKFGMLSCRCHLQMASVIARIYVAKTFMRSSSMDIRLYSGFT